MRENDAFGDHFGEPKLTKSVIEAWEPSPMPQDDDHNDDNNANRNDRREPEKIRACSARGEAMCGLILGSEIDMPMIADQSGLMHLPTLHRKFWIKFCEKIFFGQRRIFW